MMYVKFLADTVFNKYSFASPNPELLDSVFFRLVKGLSTKSSCLWKLLVGSVAEWIQNVN